jgi:hypothetical protein
MDCTTCDDSDSYWAGRIATVKAIIAKYDDALLQFSTSAIQEYTLDTGQTRQTVTKANIASLRDTRSELLNELASLEARVCGRGVRVIPGF